MSIRYTIAAFAALSIGCSADLKYGGSYTPTGAYGTSTGSYTGTATGTTHGSNQAAYYALLGSIALVGEQVDLAMSTVEVDYRNVDGEPICSGIRPLVDATSEVNPDMSVPLFGLWSLSLDVSPCGDFGPDTLEIGIGAWDAELTPAAESENLVGEQLYGLYLGTAPTVVFGATGTSEQFAGVTPPVDAAPLPDGVYQLRTLYLLPLAP